MLNLISAPSSEKTALLANHPTWVAWEALPSAVLEIQEFPLNNIFWGGRQLTVSTVRKGKKKESFREEPHLGCSSGDWPASPAKQPARKGIEPAPMESRHGDQ